MNKKILLCIVGIWSLLLSAGCNKTKLQNYSNEPAVITNIETNNHQVTDKVTVLLENGSEEVILVNTNDWTLGEEVLLSTDENNHKYEIKHKKIENIEVSPKINLIEKLETLSELNNSNMVYFDKSEIIASFSLNDTNIKNAFWVDAY